MFRGNLRKKKVRLVFFVLILCSHLCLPKLNKEAVDQRELHYILEKTAAYCEKLKRAVFHFYCTERVTETIGGIPKNSGKRQGLKNFLDSSKENRRLSTYNTWQNLRQWKVASGYEAKSKTNLYIYDYQIIKENKGIKEQRSLKKINGKKVKNIMAPTQTILYSYKNAITPIYLLSWQKQERFSYRLVKKEKVMDRKTYKISIHSKENNLEDPVAIVWVDIKDFTVLRAQIFPGAIQGYDKLLKLDKQKISDIKIHDLHTFGYLRNGIRYPTKTEIRLSYDKKAQQLLGLGGHIYREIQTKILYKKYIFFDVAVEAVTFRDMN